MTTTTARNTMGGTRPRHPDDCYLTPQPLADAICRRIEATIGVPEIVIEPSAGAGAFVRAARVTWPGSVVWAVEPNAPRGPLLTAGADSVEGATWEAATTGSYPRPVDARVLILGNPPYRLAESHVRIALDRLGHSEAREPMPRYLAFLLRVSFLAGAKRARGLHLETGGLRHVWHVTPRPSFTGDGKTDGAEYAVLVWQAGHRGPYEGGWLTWRGEP